MIVILVQGQAKFFGVDFVAFFGLFGNYDKPGPGVSKDEPKKAAPVRFEILWRKLSKLIQLNLIYMIPFIVVVALMVGVFCCRCRILRSIRCFLGRWTCMRSTQCRCRSS